MARREKTAMLVLAKKSTTASGSTTFVCFTKHFGKVYIRAKGIGKPKSKMSQLLSGAHMLRAELYWQDARFPLLTHAEATLGLSTFMESYDSLQYYWFLLELLDKTLALEDANETLFVIVEELLLLMLKYPLKQKELMTAFTVTLLDYCGHLSLEIPYGSPLSHKTLKVYYHKSLSDVVRIKVPADVLQEVFGAVLSQVEATVERSLVTFTTLNQSPLQLQGLVG